MSYSANRLLLFTVVMDTKVHALSPVCCLGKWIKLKNFKAQKAFIPANSVAQASWKSSPRVTDEAFSKAVENPESRSWFIDLKPSIRLVLAIEDLEKVGITVSQINEAALREGLPFRRAEHAFYLDLATS